MKMLKKAAAVLFAVITVASLFNFTFVSAKSADGYVYVSFEDYGVRQKKDIDDGYVDFVKQMGVIVSETKVEY
ncbi:MAG: hypothetical protein IJU45_08620, partial [Clostridia bacterium]|nr:hypothetical protein [Clostridia bacterium]